MRPDGPDGDGAGDDAACDLLFVGNQELYEIFLLDRAHATVAGYHIVQARKLLGKFPRLSKYINPSGRFLLTVEELFFDNATRGRPWASCEAAASASVWCRVLDSVKAPELPLDVVEERLEALQQRLLRFATGGDPSAATLIMVETSNLLDFLGLRHHPASSSLRSCVGELSKRSGRMVALTDAVKVLAGLRQFIEALYGDANPTATFQDQQLFEALGACGPCGASGPGSAWGRCGEILRREWSPENDLEDETVQRARAWLNSRGLCDPSPEKQLEDPLLVATSQRRSSRRRTVTPAPLPTPSRRSRGPKTTWAAEVRRQEAMSDRLKAKACAEKMPLPCPEAVRRAQQRAKKIQLKQAEEEALKLEERLYHGQLVAAKTAELFRERDQRRVRSARSVSREGKELTGRSLRDSHRERPRCRAPAPEACPPCPGQ